MNEEQKSNLRRALAALRENPKKARDMMRDDAGGRCCLCVMSDVAEDIQGLERGSLELDDALPSSSLAEFYGIPNSTTVGFSFLLNVPSVIGGPISVATLNDSYAKGYDMAHTEIADLIEQQYLPAES